MRQSMISLLRENSARILVLAFLVGASLTDLGCDTLQADDEIRAADVCARVDVVRAELESLRWYMGRPKNEQPEIAVRRAAPREAYFQALVLLANANRLCFDHTREQLPEPATLSASIEAADVLTLVEATHDRIKKVQLHYGIPSEAVQAQADPSKTPTDVFRAIVEANRQINLLLDERVAPSDVFQQVTLAVGYASRLLETFPNAATLPETPEFEPGKRPADVLRRLLECMAHIRTVASISSLDVLEFEGPSEWTKDAEPSDVLHLASLIVAELAYLHSRVPDVQPPRDVYYVGRKFPSDVYQRAGILLLQLEELAKQVEKNPDWLSQSREHE